MSSLSAPDEQDLAAAVRVVCTIGLAKAQDALEASDDERVAPFATALSVLAAAGSPLGLRQLLEQAIEATKADEIKEHMRQMLDLDRSGEPAKVRYERVAEASGFAYATVRIERRDEWADGVARAMRRMVEASAAPPGARFRVSDLLRERLEMLCTCAALQLAALRSPDGSWAAKPGEDGELSTTSRAASSLHKALGAEWADPRLRSTLTWIAQHHDERRGGYGVSQEPGNPPGWRTQPQIVAQPRQTASAIKIMRQFDGVRERRIGLGTKYLLERQTRDGIAWAATGHPDDEPDLLTTVYVLDALLVIQPDLRHLAAVLDRSEFAVIDEQFNLAVSNGLEWVRERRRDGGWTGDGGNVPDPYDTAQVLGFAWQAPLTHVGPTIEYLRASCRDGGIPAKEGGQPAIAPTAMALLGLLRATTEGHEELLQAATAFLGRVAERRDLSTEVFSATFTLLLGQPSYSWLSGDAWQERARAGAAAIIDGIDAGTAPQEVAAAAIAELRPGHRRIEPALVAAMESA